MLPTPSVLQSRREACPLLPLQPPASSSSQICWGNIPASFPAITCCIFYSPHNMHYHTHMHVCWFPSNLFWKNPWLKRLFKQRYPAVSLGCLHIAEQERVTPAILSWQSLTLGLRGGGWKGGWNLLAPAVLRIFESKSVSLSFISGTNEKPIIPRTQTFAAGVSQQNKQNW